MSKFDSGVKRYIKARAVVEVSFPVSWRDSMEIACKHCQFYDRAKQRCWLNGKVVNFPDGFVGAECPLEAVEDDGSQ